MIFELDTPENPMSTVGSQQASHSHPIPTGFQWEYPQKPTGKPTETFMWEYP